MQKAGLLKRAEGLPAAAGRLWLPQLLLMTCSGLPATTACLVLQAELDVKAAEAGMGAAAGAEGAGCDYLSPGL